MKPNIRKDLHEGSHLFGSTHKYTDTFFNLHTFMFYVYTLVKLFFKMVLFWCRTVIPAIHQVLVQEGDAASVLGNCHDAVPSADFRVEGG